MSDTQATDRFPETQWSLVLRASRGGDPAALAHLCQAYWQPVYCFLRKKGAGRDGAAEGTQAFFAKLIERNDIASVDAGCGRFRSWLRSSVKNHFLNEMARQKAQKWGGGQVHVSIDPDLGEGRFSALGEEPVTPERLFDICWAQTVLSHAFRKLREEFTDYEIPELVAQLLEDSDADAPSYAMLASKYQDTENNLRVKRHRLKQRVLIRYRTLLRGEIEQTVQHPGSVDDELRQLQDALF